MSEQQKSLGQIAYETHWPIRAATSAPWREIGYGLQVMYHKIANAVQAEILRRQEWLAQTEPPIETRRRRERTEMR
jgi:hypothetical protein